VLDDRLSSRTIVAFYEASHEVGIDEFQRRLVLS
jgi:hypothetical protein